MARTFGGMLFYGASKIQTPTALVGIGAGQTSLIRNATGDWSWNNTAGAGPIQYFTNIDTIKRPYFNFPTQPGDGVVPVSNEFNELFGASAGPGNPWNGGMTPATGSQFGTAFTPWGIAVIDVFAVYVVQTAPTTSVTIGLRRSSYVENVAFTSAAVGINPTTISSTVNGSATAAHVQTVTLPQPLIYEATDFSDLIMELIVTESATSTTKVYGMGMHIAVEYS